MRRTKGGLAVAVALSGTALLGLSACGGSSGAGTSSGSKVKLSIVAYSTPQAAYEKIIEAYKKTDAGKNIDFSTSYGPSGDQSRAVVAGLKADIVEFSLAPDMDRLVKANLVASTWSAGTYKGMITDSVVVIATRKGNPKGIKDWPDLIKPGVQVITPNPSTSGGARWNIMAAYGGTLASGATEAQGNTYLKALLKNVPVQDDSARKSLTTFTGGKGDALLSYENDAIFAQQKGQSLDYTVPNSTILIENPIAVTSNSAHPAEAKAFLDYLYTEEAQKIFSDNGYRPVLASAKTKDFPTPSGLFDITKFGGWKAVTDKFFDADKGIVTGIEEGLGVPTKK
ncbi:MAG: sulfate/thiosulfate transport system substrate-binding protein [Frankiales bacterium]|nr:sulfate/thiosulfate transport system substrate-binding protein [Frankiales bacterium]